MGAITFDDILTKPPAKPYMGRDSFNKELSGAVPGAKLTGSYRTPARENQLRSQGAATVPAGAMSNHSRGAPDAPGAEDFTAPGVTADVLARTRKLPGVRDALFEQAAGGQGAHYHADMGAGPISFDDILAKPPGAAAPGGGTKPKPSPEELALTSARRPVAQGGMTQPPGAEPLRQFSRQLTANADEALGAAMFAGKSQLPRLAGKDPGYGFGEAYNAARTAEKEETESRKGPAATAAGVAGGIAGLATGGTEARAAKAGLGLLPRLLPAAKQGAALGAAGGAAGADRYQDIPKATAAGTVAGGLLGPAGEVLLSGARLAGQAANTLSNNKFGSAVASATHKLAVALYKDGLRGAQLDKAMEKWRTAGVDQSLLDLGGKHTQKLVRQAGAGAGQHAVRRYDEKTEQETASQAIDQVKKLVGEKRPMGDVVEAMEKQRKTIAQQKYPKQYGLQVDSVPVLHALRDPQARVALNNALNDAVVNRDYETAKDINKILNNLRMMEVAPKSFAKLIKEHAQTVRAGTLDQIQSALQRTAKRAGERTGGKYKAQGFSDRAKDLSFYLDNLPALKDARKTYRLYSEMIDGFEQGHGFLKDVESDASLKAFSSLGKGAKQTARIGMRQALTEQIEGNTTGALRTLAYSPKAKKLLTAMFGEDEAGRLSRAADYRLEKLSNAGKAAGGAPPSERPHVGSFVTSPVHAFKHATIRTATDAAFGMSDKESEAIAALGTAPARDVVPGFKPKPTPGRARAGTAGRYGAAQTISNVANSGRSRKKKPEPDK